ncbi:MAG: hypothetical protein L3K04_03545 [Thermoplasmata archaeon]|nr:hypothetical protein [Thermoplasmata archaeon]MCI4342420.1 hypothetical protein [Thermoplasmata archaeon]
MKAPRHHLEADMAAPVVRFLERRGYRTYRDPDGKDYLDLVARRGEELGLVELKLSAARTVLGQALRRRGWGDWVAVALDGRRAAERALAASPSGHSERVGVLAVLGEEVEELRPAAPVHGAGCFHPFPELRARLVLLLDAVDSGELPAGIGWGALWRSDSGGRHAGREWRIEELAPPSESD